MCNSNCNHILIKVDLNLKNIDWETLTTEDNSTTDLNYRFVECIHDSYLFHHVLEPTQQRGTDRPTNLDVLLTNEENMISELEISAPLGKSDHSILKFNFQCYMDKEPPRIKKLYHKGDCTKMNEMLQGVDWGKAFENFPNDVNKQWDFFKQKYYEAEEKYIPQKTSLHQWQTITEIHHSSRQKEP